VLQGCVMIKKIRSSSDHFQKNDLRSRSSKI
jgi:hypothetical protein